jgi:hypothetical protein
MAQGACASSRAVVVELHQGVVLIVGSWQLPPALWHIIGTPPQQWHSSGGIRSRTGWAVVVVCGVWRGQEGVPAGPKGHG